MGKGSVDTKARELQSTEWIAQKLEAIVMAVRTQGIVSYSAHGHVETIGVPPGPGPVGLCDAMEIRLRIPKESVL